MFQQNFGSQHVVLAQKDQSTQFGSTNKNKNSSFINLVNEVFDFLPRLFTIKTNNGSYKFNIVLLKDMSQTISKQLETDPNNLEYHLDIIDNQQTMKKFEEIFQGHAITFEFNELLTVRQIIQSLCIDQCPIYFKADSNITYYSIPSKIEIEIQRKSVLAFLCSQLTKTFTIKTNKKEYKCTEYGALSSKIIREKKKENPEMTEYFYNYDDENDEFQLICDIFNFQNVFLTVSNMDSLKIISDDLQIEPIINSIDKYINSYEDSVQLIDDKKMIIDTIDEIFHLLHNIHIITVESVKQSILNSNWVNTEENIQELVACIFQTVRVGYKLQPYLVDLVISLHESSLSNENKNKLNLFLPYLTFQLQFSFSKSPFYSSFLFKLAQKKVVKMDEILENAMNIVMNKKNEYKNRDVVNVLLWFLPELLEKNKDNEELFNLSVDLKNALFFKKFLPSNIESYKIMRDSGLPIDEISRSIFNDDVDTLQSIVSKRGIDINETKIEPTPFDIFDFDNKISFLNYSVMHGSVKCFKYLLLNHAEMDYLTFFLSIYGGNTEIIRSVDQNNPQLSKKNKQVPRIDNDMMNTFSFYNIETNFYYKYDNFYLMNICAPAIMNHQNDLFTWIFENKFNRVDSLLDVAFIAVQNGNANALIHCIDKGLKLNQNTNNFITALIAQACHDGFFKILQLIVSLCQSELKNIQIPMDHFYYSGNLLIYNLMKEKVNTFNMNHSNVYPILSSIERKHNKLIMEVISKGEIVLCNGSSFGPVFSAIVKRKNIELFNFLKDKYTFDKIDNLYLMYNDRFSLFDVLNESCTYGFIEAVKDITEYILQKNSSADFTNAFYCAACAKQKEVYNYLLDKDVNISLKPNDSMLYGLTYVENEICERLLDKIKPDIKNDVLDEVFRLAVSNGNKDLVKLLAHPDRLNYSSLISAVQSSNLEIVNIILSINSDPSFINIVRSDGSALNIAVKKNNLEVVKRLLSIPGIDANLYDTLDCTPLITAINSFNLEMIDLIVDHYGDKIQSQIWQINSGIKMILKNLSFSNLISLSEEHSINNKDDDEYNDDDDDENSERGLHKINIIDAKSKFINSRENVFKTILKLAQFENVDLNCHFSSYTLLSYACEVNELDLFKLLLRSNKVNVNNYAPLTGSSPLMIAIENDNNEIAQLLIEYDQTDINHRNYNGQTALTIAVSKANYIIIKILVNDKKFDHKKSALLDAFFKSNDRITELLFNVKEFDVNSNMKIKNFINLFIDTNNSNNMLNLVFSSMLKISFITPLIKAIIDRNEEIIDSIIAHPLFNKEKSRYVDAIFSSVYMDDINIFRKLLNIFGNDVNLINQEGKSLLYFSIYMTANDITTEILNSDNFDPVKSQIVSCFLKAGLFITSSEISNTNSITNFNNHMFSQFGIPAFGIPTNGGNENPVVNGAFPAIGANPNNAHIAQMNEICDFDEENGNLIKFNEFLPSGKTFLTSINPNLMNINNVVTLLIERGADPNLPDKNGVYPIEIGIYLYNSNYLLTMLHLQNIDLNIISSGNHINSVKGDTILHMLIRCQMNMFNAFNDILNMNDLNILNNENEEGDTALMIACRLGKTNFISGLFNKDDLDYTHRNKEGKDALEILESVANKFNQKKYNWNTQRFTNNTNNYPKEKCEYYQKIMKLFYP